MSLLMDGVDVVYVEVHKLRIGEAVPCKYDISNIYQANEGCTMCNGTGMIATYVGTITCPNCRDWVRDESGRIVSNQRVATGEVPSFRTELMQTTHGQLPSNKHYADGAAPAPSRIVKAGSPAARAARRR